MRRLLSSLFLVVTVAACTGGSGAPTTTTLAQGSPSTSSTSSTTTTEPTRECENLAEDVADLLEDMVDVLNDMTTEQFLDTRRWPEALFGLQIDGEEFDRRAAEAGCDPAAIQGLALEEVGDLDVESTPARMLIEALFGSR